MKYLVIGGWRGVERFVTRDKLGHWELDDRRSAYRFEKEQAHEVAALVHGIVVSEDYTGD